eukprot:6815451-Pyramimonas_sp.AAC.1
MPMVGHRAGGKGPARFAPARSCLSRQAIPHQSPGSGQGDPIPWAPGPRPSEKKIKIVKHPFGPRPSEQKKNAVKHVPPVHSPKSCSGGAA